jgi:hypothetical protein
MSAYRLTLVSRIVRNIRIVRRGVTVRIAEVVAIAAIFRIVRIMAIVGSMVSMTAISAMAQDQSIKERVTSPAGVPRLPQFTTSIIQPGNRAPSSLASTENLNITEPMPGLPTTYKITFRQFMGYLQDSNISLAAQRFNIPIAQAQLKAARIYPDPTFQSGYAGDVSDERQVTTYSGQLSETILLGGKIKARTDAATETLALSRAQLADFLRNLRVQAANAFIDGLTESLVLQRKSLALTRAQQLVEVNE